MASSGRFDGGVRYYTTGTLEIYFPEDAIACKYCPMFKTEYGTRRDYCGRTAEALVNPEIMIGGMCPIRFDTENVIVLKKEEK